MTLLGSYQNAFALLRECYAERTVAHRPRGPDPHLGRGHDAGREPRLGRAVGRRLADVAGHVRRTDALPGEPGATGRNLTVWSFVAERCTW